MVTFLNLKDIYDQARIDVYDKLPQALEHPAIKAKLAQAIEEKVYSFSTGAKNPYIPRMENGGLSDPNNMKATVGMVGNEVHGNLRTYARGNTEWPGGATHPNNELPIDEIVVSGKGYSWKNSLFHIMAKDMKSPIERDFYAHAYETGLITDEDIAALLEQILKDLRW